MEAKFLNIQDLKLHFDSLFCFASQVPFSNNHPLPVIQSIKSLIGIKPENPPHILLKWLEIYIGNFDFDSNKIKKNITSVDIEVIDMDKLGKFIYNNDKSEALLYLEALTKVASAEYISEYLMELATYKTTSHVLFCWNIFKTIRHAKEEELNLLLDLGVECLIDMEEDEDRNNCELYFYYEQINKTPLIRSSTLLPKINGMIDLVKSKLSVNSNTILPEDVIESINKNGIIGLHKSLKQFSIDEFSPQLLLRLDSIRSNIQYSDYKKEFFFEFNSIVGGDENIK